MSHGKDETEFSKWAALRLELEPRIKEARYSLYRIKSNPLALTGVAIIAVFFLIAAFAPYLAPPNPKLGDPRDPGIIPKTWKPEPEPPSSEFPFGTGPYGTDIYYGVIWGARTSLRIAFTVVGVTAVIGIVLGSVAGYFGGKLENLIMRVTDMFLAVPPLLLAMGIASVLGRSIFNLVLILIFVWWPRYARLVRGEILSVKERTFADSARAIGCSELQVLFLHVLPNAIFPVLVIATLDLGSVVLVAAGLSFLGLGAEPFTAEWGLIISEGRDWIMMGKWWASFFAGAAIFFFVLGWNLLGDAFRDILDPRMRRV